MHLEIHLMHPLGGRAILSAGQMKHPPDWQPRSERHVLVVAEKTPPLVVPLQNRGFKIKLVRRSRECLSLCAGHPFDLAVLSVDEENQNPLSLVEEIVGLDPALPVIVIDREPSLDKAVAIMRAGASDYLVDSAGNDRLMSAIDQALMVEQWPDSGPTRLGNLLGRSDSMRTVYRQIKNLAIARGDVLISGEPGTGKKLAAREIVQRSAWSSGPLMAISCASFTPTLLASELFGHEAGTFAGALESRAGLFETANGGTLLLDGIDHVPLVIQTMLLRVLEEGRVRRLGSTQSRATHVRLLATTTLNLESGLERGAFLQGLYQRFGLGRLKMPPLRKRLEDIPALAMHLMARIGAHSPGAKHLTRGALRVLLSYRWPGNVPELESVLESACLLTEGRIIRRTAIAHFIPTVQKDPPPEPLAKAERRHIQSALKWAGGDVGKASTILGVSKPKMYRILKRLTLSVVK